MRGWAMIAGAGMAASLLAAPTLGFAQTAAKPARGGPDPLQAVIFAGQDAVIDLGPIVPTPIAAPPSAAIPRPAAEAVTTAASTPRFTVTRIRVDGGRETRAIDPTELQALGRAAPPSPPVPTKKLAPIERRPARTVATIAAPAPAPSPKLALRTNWTLASAAPAASDAGAGAEIEGSDAADAVSPLLVRSTADPSKRKQKGKATLGVRDGRGYGEQGRFYIFAGGKGGGVGLNVVNHGDAWGNDGVSWDRSGFVGQRSAGIGWRKGDVTTSLGWAHEKNRVKGFFGFPSEKDERVALNLTWRPSPK